MDLGKSVLDTQHRPHWLLVCEDSRYRAIFKTRPFGRTWMHIAKEFNKQLQDRVVKLRAELLQAALTYTDIYTAKYKLISNARDIGNYIISDTQNHHFLYHKLEKQQHLAYCINYNG